MEHLSFVDVHVRQACSRDGDQREAGHRDAIEGFFDAAIDVVPCRDRNGYQQNCGESRYPWSQMVHAEGSLQRIRLLRAEGPNDVQRIPEAQERGCGGYESKREPEEYFCGCLLLFQDLCHGLLAAIQLCRTEVSQPIGLWRRGSIGRLRVRARRNYSPTRYVCSAIARLISSARASARRPSSPLTAGRVRLRTASRKLAISRRSGSPCSTGTFFKDNPGDGWPPG